MPDLRKLKALPKRARRMPRALPPRGIEVRYRAMLQQLVAFAHALLKARLYPRLPSLLGETRDDASYESIKRGLVQSTGGFIEVHSDAKPRSVNRVMQQVTEAFDRTYPLKRLERMAGQIAEQTSGHQKEQLFKQIKGAIGVELNSVADTGAGSAIASFVAENVALIKTIPRTYFADVEARVLDAMRSSTRHEELAPILEERLGVAESKAAVIARDQVLGFSADLNQLRQKGLGVVRYIWRTSNDERVREAHAERDGEVYEWAEGPGDAEDPGDGEHPGDGIQCRCYADPYLEDLL